MANDNLYFNTNSSFFLFQRQVKCMINFTGIKPQKAEACALLRATKMATQPLFKTSVNNVFIFHVKSRYENNLY